MPSRSSSKLEDNLNRFANEIIDDLKDIVKTCDSIDSIQWTQYTPYFDDDNGCVFGVYELTYKFSDKTFIGSSDKAFIGRYYLGGYIPQWRLPEVFKKSTDIVNHEEMSNLYKICQDLHKLHSQLSPMKTTLRTQFGDHVSITLTKNGICVEHYDHD